MRTTGVCSSFLVLLASAGFAGPAEWPTVRGALERYSYTPVVLEAGYRAHNAAQQWTTAFDGKGFAVEPHDASWKWGLRLKSYGFPGNERPRDGAARVEARQQGLVYHWDEWLEEWFINDSRGLEHGFTLRARPGGAGDVLRFRIAVEGDLHAVIHGDGGAVDFTDRSGKSVVLYAGLKVWDASGKPVPAAFRAGEDDLVLEVQAAGIRYPLTIDPVAQQAYLKASNTGAEDSFGWAVAVYGDTLVVGAPREDSAARGVNGNQMDNAATDSGAAYVFVRNGGSWSQQAYLKASNTDTTIGASADGFGYAVAIDGDTIVVGAPGESSSAMGVNGDQNNNNAASSGAAYVFVRNAGVWTQQAYLKPSNTSQLQNFGHAVSISGNTVVVGAPFEESSATGVNGNAFNLGATHSGAAYVFVRSGSAWSQQAYLKASNTGIFDHFGEDVTVSGDTIAVGAPLEDSGAAGVNGDGTRNDIQDSGAVYIFVRSGAQWAQQAYVKASNPGTGDFFGFRVALSLETLVAGAPNEDSASTGVNGNQGDSGLTDSGAAYVFTRSGGVWGQQAYLKASNPDAADYFGGSVAISGDRVVIGAEDEDSNGSGQTNNSLAGAGAAYVFVRGGSLWSQDAYLKASNVGANDEFGWAVSVSGDTVVVSAVGESSAATGVNGNQADNSAPMSGAVYVLVSTGAAGAGLRFVPMTPCRLVDTRPVYAGSLTGAFGPPFLSAGAARTIPIPNSSACFVPPSAKAYVLNVTIDTFYDQTGAVDFLTLWPTGEPRPDFYTVRTTTGGYIANAAIVKAGVNGAVDVYASQAVNLILDISGYFTDDVGAAGLLYYPIQPCRAVDTRGPIYSSLPPPYGNQRMQARENRTFRLPGSPGCALPVAAAYSLQMTLAPGELTNGDPVAFITAYPTGVPQPNISNTNAFFGYATANSAIVPASANGSIDVFTLDATNLILDINGYFAPDDGTGRGLFYFPVRQCRVMNTQNAVLAGPFGGPAISPGADRTVPVPQSGCAGLPATAKAWALNAWVFPNGNGMPYLSLWPSGTAWPNISQLNAFQGQTLANSGIVPASATGSVDVRVAGTTHVGLEVTGYFSR